MALVFLSHSSRDNEAAARMKAWLEGQHFEAPFLDFDKHNGIPPGAEWEKTLYDEIRRSQALLILQTPNWSASRWCFAEFTQARALGKPVFQVIEDDGGAAEPPIARDLQRLDLRSDREGGLAALRKRLIVIAEQDQGGFPWPPPEDPDRPPFPGLMRFEEEDAAVFFGRDGDWRAVIERLNSRRVQGGVRLLVLQGASGAGKSSLLRAGVLPRLRRAGRQWLVVPPLRPKAKPLVALAKSWALALERAGEWRGLHEQLKEAARSDSPAVLLQSWAEDLQMAAAAPDAQILLSIDQGEELFTEAEAEAEEKQGFLAVLGAALSQPLPLQAVMSMRTDAVGELEQVAALVNRFETMSLGPLPMVRYREIIEGPAKVAGLNVEEAFVAKAVRDTETEDALPLLAVALHDLHERFGEDGYLTLSNYQTVGDAAAGLSPLENAVRRIADDALLDVKDSEAELRALRDAFIPAMVRLSLTEEGAFSRRVARWVELPTAAHPLLQRLVEKRLLVTGKAEGTIEVAHEALLRNWPTLRDWLDQDRQKLEQEQRVRRRCEELRSALPEVRLDALRSLEGLANETPRLLEPAVEALAAVVAKAQSPPGELMRVVRLLGICGGVTAESALEGLLEREQLREESDRPRLKAVLLLLTTTSATLLHVQQKLGPSAGPRLRSLLVPSATLRADGRAVSTRLVRMNLRPSPREAGALPLLRHRDGRGAWFEELTPQIALTMVEIPAGEFLMGSPTTEPERNNNEGPQHRVRLEGFFMGQTPITQAQWRVVASWEPREGEIWERKLNADPSNFQGERARLLEGETSTDQRPVENVSWHDAMEFCCRLSQRTGRRYTLPSEAQWEYACRAGSTTTFHFGETITTDLANYNGDNAYGDGPKGEYREQSTPVGRFPANAWGLQDMHGNVWEWCLDAWHDSYKGAPADGSAWLVPKAGEDAIRLLRGGSWSDDPWDCRSAYRGHDDPGFVNYDVGFRVVCLPQGPS